MIMRIARDVAWNAHRNPDECLPYLGFQFNDGGRTQYFKEEVPEGIDDCAVVAVSLTTSYNPATTSPGLSYGGTLHLLEIVNQDMEPWKKRNFRETHKDHYFRRAKEIFEGWKVEGIPRHQDPKYGTDTNVISRLLRMTYGFRFVFGEPLPPREFCLCVLQNGTFVVDGVGTFTKSDGSINPDGDHAFAVIKGKIVADYDFRERSRDFHVMHIWQKGGLY